MAYKVDDNRVNYVNDVGNIEGSWTCSNNLQAEWIAGVLEERDNLQDENDKLKGLTVK